MQGLSNQAKGLLITGLGVLILTPDSLVVRLVATDHWSLIFWRSLLISTGLGLGLAVIWRGATLSRFRAVGRNGLGVAAMYLVGSIGFIYALTHTSVANTLIIVSSAPLFAAMVGRPLLGESLAARTWVAISLALAGIAITVSDGFGGGSLDGDIAALITAAALGIELSLIRRGRPVNMLPAIVLGGIATAVVILPLARPFSLSAADAALLVTMGLVLLPLSFGLVALGPRYIPAPEVALLLLLETVLGPFWVWLVLAEAPGARALLGGALVVGTLAAHAALSLRRTSPA